ncbi:hypothetical protein ACHAXR_011274 [Thalassiosira sp. AJA248-18]
MTSSDAAAADTVELVHGSATTADDDVHHDASWWNFVRRRPRSTNSSQTIQQQHQTSSVDDSSEPKEGGGDNATIKGWKNYQQLLLSNRNYRLYLCSHFCQHTGDWFVHVASLIAIEEMVPDSGTAISILVSTRMIPMILFSSFGGALADRYDRRKLMITLDAWNASVALLYLVALHYSSPMLLYTVSCVRHTVVAMYEPVTRSIVPLLVQSDEELKYAMTMNGMAWASTLAVGGMLAGWTAATFGVGSCFVMDSVTYIVSTAVIWMVRGKYCIREGGLHGAGISVASASASTCVPAFSTRGKGSGLSRIRTCIHNLCCPLTSFVQMFLEMMKYLVTCKFGLLVFLKATGNVTWGSADIINVHYAYVKDDELATSTNIGYIYSSIGLGCLLGPIAANYFTDMARPATLQMVCIAALGFVVVGWLGIASANLSMGWLCLFNSIRAFGSSIVWINSTLILQKLTTSHMLGRVISFDFATTMLCDTIAAFVAGINEDIGVATSNIANGAAILVGTLWVFWSLYHARQKGAARKHFNVGDALSPSVSLHKELERLGNTGGDLRLTESGAEEHITDSLTSDAAFA